MNIKDVPVIPSDLVDYDKKTASDTDRVRMSRFLKAQEMFAKSLFPREFAAWETMWVSTKDAKNLRKRDRQFFNKYVKFAGSSS